MVGIKNYLDLPNVLSVIIVGFIFSYIFANVLPDIGKILEIAWLSRNILGTRNMPGWASFWSQCGKARQ